MSLIPCHLRIIHRICDAIIIEWSKQTLVQRIIKTYLRRNGTIKVLCDVLAIHTFWCSRQTKQYLGPKVVDNLTIGRCRCMVHLIYHNIVVIVRRKLKIIQAIIERVF